MIFHVNAAVSRSTVLIIRQQSQAIWPCSQGINDPGHPQASLQQAGKLDGASCGETGTRDAAGSSQQTGLQFLVCEPAWLACKQDECMLPSSLKRER